MASTSIQVEYFYIIFVIYLYRQSRILFVEEHE